MTDEELNRKFDRVENQIEALTESLDRMEEAQLADRQRFDEAQAKADARIARLERVVTLIVSAGRRERRKLNGLIDVQRSTEASLRTLSEAQTVTERNLALMVEHFDRRTDTQAASQTQDKARLARLEESQAALQTAMAEMAQSNLRRDDALAKLAQAMTRTSQRVDAIEEGM